MKICTFLLLVCFTLSFHKANADEETIPPASDFTLDEATPVIPSKFSIEILGGSLTYHVIAGASDLFANKVSSDGRLISNFLYGLSVSYIHSDSYYLTGRYFKGNNSIGESINGGTFSVGPTYEYCDVGFIIGGYFQDDYKYLQQGLMPFSISSGSNAMVPILGIEINPRITLWEKYFIKLNNILTPLITNHTLSIGMYF